jgi:AcrR family transcriptional regulator
MPPKKGADKKNQILEALNQCLQTKPFDQTTIKDIAQAAGINHGLLHYYFKNKEDILVHYIDYVIDHYRTMFNDWLTQKEGEGVIGRELIESFFQFMNEKITLNRPLSKAFIEIWEIAVYKPAVKAKLQRAYKEWVEILTDMLDRVIHDTDASRRIGFSIVAFLEGMALFSIILDPDKKEFKKILAGFQEKIVEML